MSFAYPLPIAPQWTSPFGAPRSGHSHEGIDLGAPIGTPILAAASGYVEVAGWGSSTAGLEVRLDHGNGYKTKYLHCSRVRCSVGQRVSQRQTIAEVGKTGNAVTTLPHLHFEIVLDGSPLNPASLVSIPASTGVREPQSSTGLLLAVAVGAVLLVLLID